MSLEEPGGSSGFWWRRVWLLHGDKGEREGIAKIIMERLQVG
jgi:hypothetical protein